MAKTIKFPEGLLSPGDKTAFLYRLQERLRLEHNERGTALRENRISQQEWTEFLISWEDKSNKVTNEILAARALMKADNFWKIDLEDVFGL